MKVVFFGTPLFSAHVLDYLIQHQIDVCAVISKPDRPKGRSGIPVPTPVKNTALAHRIPLYQPEIVSALDFAPILQAYHADLFVVVAYGEIIKEHLLQMPTRACINLHTSLLPKYRGAAPIQRAIIHGETETGVTIMHMAKKMDAGDIIDQVKVSIGPNTTFGELEHYLCEEGKKVLLRILREFDIREPSRTPQENALATFAPKIELEDCEIFWDRPAQELHNLIRGVNPYPGAWCYVRVRNEKKRLKINKTRVVPCEKTVPGTLLHPHLTKNNVTIATGEWALELLEVQLEGKKSMSSEELTRGISRQHFEWILNH